MGSWPEAKARSTSKHLPKPSSCRRSTEPSHCPCRSFRTYSVRSAATAIVSSCLANRTVNEATLSDLAAQRIGRSATGPAADGRPKHPVTMPNTTKGQTELAVARSAAAPCWAAGVLSEVFSRAIAAREARVSKCVQRDVLPMQMSGEFVTGAEFHREAPSANIAPHRKCHADS
jgi:hypothetical protein